MTLKIKKRSKKIGTVIQKKKKYGTRIQKKKNI